MSNLKCPHCGTTLKSVGSDLRFIYFLCWRCNRRFRKEYGDSGLVEYGGY